MTVRAKQITIKVAEVEAEVKVKARGNRKASVARAFPEAAADLLNSPTIGEVASSTKDLTAMTGKEEVAAHQSRLNSPNTGLNGGSWLFSICTYYFFFLALNLKARPSWDFLRLQIVL